MPADQPAAPPDATVRTPDPDATSHRGDSLPPVVLHPPTSGRYVLGAEIARGGMGAVFRATDTALGREVAVKLLQEQFGPDSGTARRFADEAHITGQLQHPGIPPVHDFGTLPDGRPFLAMKLIKGDTLHDLLRTRRDPADARGRFVAVFEAVCQAVGYAHAHDVIHRDLKPANVMVGAFGEVQVMDWRLAKVLRPAGAADAADPDATGPNTEVRSLRDADGDHTKAGSVMGTLPYMPPEQAAGAAHKATPRSDVFGLGAMLAVVLTGRPPFEGGSADTTRVKAAQGDVADCLARLDACGAEPELVALCKRCLSPKPADRPANGGEVAAAVAEFRQAAEARARQAELDRATAEATVAEGRKRRRVQLALAGAVVLLVAGAGGVAVWRAGETRDRRGQVAALLEEAEAALRRGDADRAAGVLDTAERADDGTATARRAAAHDDLALLRALDRVDSFRWTPVRSKFPNDAPVAAEWAKVFAGAGLVPGQTPPAEFAARVTGSSAEPAIVAALDGWLALAADGAVRDVLAAADPDPVRDEVRHLLAAKDAARLAVRADRLTWADQPRGLVRACAAAVPDEVARRLLTRACSARPNDFGTVMQLGLTYDGNRADTAAERVRWFQAAVALRPRHAAARLNLGMALTHLGRHDDALVEYDLARGIEKDYPAVYTARGITFEAKGDFAAAAEAYRAAMRFDPTDPSPHNNLGNVLRRTGDPDGSAAAYREAIRLDADYSPPHNGLGGVFVAKGQYQAAIDEYQEAIRLDPTSPTPHNGLGNARSMLHDTDGAVAAYREAIRLRRDYPEAHNGLGNALRTKGDLPGAEAAYRESIRLNPTDPTPHNGLGNALYYAKKLPVAEAAYREAIRLKPEYAAPYNGLGTVLKTTGDVAGAAVAYREAARLDPTLANAHHGLGTALAELEDWDGAVAAYLTARELIPRNPLLRHNLGVARDARHELPEAAAEFAEAVRLNPRMAPTHAFLGDVLRKLGRHADAVAAYRAALAIQPNLAPARDGLDYCERVQRGEVPTAPLPRAVAR